jgi:hypothetical protein
MALWFNSPPIKRSFGITFCGDESRGSGLKSVRYEYPKKGGKAMGPREVLEVERIFDLRQRKQKRIKKLQKRRRSKCILSELLKSIFILIIAVISATFFESLSKSAPEKALLVFECCAIVLVIVLVGLWLDKPWRR